MPKNDESISKFLVIINHLKIVLSFSRPPCQQGLPWRRSGMDIYRGWTSWKPMGQTVEVCVGPTSWGPLGFLRKKQNPDGTIVRERPSHSTLGALLHPFQSCWEARTLVFTFHSSVWVRGEGHDVYMRVYLQRRAITSGTAITLLFFG